MSELGVRVIKCGGRHLSLDQLERASAKLLVSRIRGLEPQISFTFVQRLLDELIQRRRVEAEEQRELDRLAAKFANSEADVGESVPSLKSEDIQELRSFEIEVVESVEAAEGAESDESDESDDDISDVDLDIDLDDASSAETQLSLPVIVDEIVVDNPPIDLEEFELACGGKFVKTESVGGSAQPQERRLNATKRRAPVLACSRPRHGLFAGALNVWRVMLISAIAVFVMVVGVIALG